MNLVLILIKKRRNSKFFSGNKVEESIFIDTGIVKCLL